MGECCFFKIIFQLPDQGTWVLDLQAVGLVNGENTESLNPLKPKRYFSVFFSFQGLFVIKTKHRPH